MLNSCGKSNYSSKKFNSAVVPVKNETEHDIEVILILGGRYVAYTEIPVEETVTFIFDGEVGVYDNDILFMRAKFFTHMLIRVEHKYYYSYYFYSGFGLVPQVVYDYYSSSSPVFDSYEFESYHNPRPSTSVSNNNLIYNTVRIESPWYYNTIVEPLCAKIDWINEHNRSMENWGYEFVDGVYYFNLDKFNALIDGSEALSQYVAKRNEEFEIAKEAALDFMEERGVYTEVR